MSDTHLLLRRPLVLMTPASFLFLQIVFRSLFYLSIEVRPLLAGRLSSPEYRERCGSTWQKAYRKLHRDIVLHESDMSIVASEGVDSSKYRYLVVMPQPYRGVADTALSYVSSFLWALLTDRAFLVLDGADIFDCGMDAFRQVYNPHVVHWDSWDRRRGLARHISDAVQHNDSATFTLQIPTGGRVMSGTNLLAAQYRREMRTFPDAGDIREFPAEGHERDVLLMSLDRGILYDLFTSSSDVNRRALERLGFTGPAHAFGCIFHFLFRRVHDAQLCVGGCAVTAATLQLAGADSPEEQGASSLSGEAETGRAAVRIAVQLSFECSAAPQYVFCVDGLLEMYRRQGRRALLLLLTESLHIQRALKQRYGDQLLLPSGEPVPPFDLVSKELLAKPNKSREECARISAWEQHGALASARDLLLLALTDVQVVSTSGALGVVGALARLRRPSSAHPAPVMFGVSIDHRERKFCNMTPAGDPLSLFAQSWKGI